MVIPIAPDKGASDVAKRRLEEALPGCELRLFFDDEHCLDPYAIRVQYVMPRGGVLNVGYVPAEWAKTLRAFPAETLRAHLTAEYHADTRTVKIVCLDAGQEDEFYKEESSRKYWRT